MLRKTLARVVQPKALSRSRVEKSRHELAQLGIRPLDGILVCLRHGALLVGVGGCGLQQGQHSLLHKRGRAHAEWIGERSFMLGEQVAARGGPCVQQQQLVHVAAPIHAHAAWRRV